MVKIVTMIMGNKISQGHSLVFLCETEIRKRSNITDFKQAQSRGEFRIQSNIKNEAICKKSSRF